MPTGHFVLLIDSEPGRSQRLAGQLVRLGVEPIRVADLEEAVDTVKARRYSIAAVLIPADLPGRHVAKAMKSMRRREPVLPAMAYGKPPAPAQRADLRRADVLLALWDGYDEGVLRFQINRLVSGEAQSAIRSSRRAPVHTPVRILVGGREKSGTLYNLSEGGCFIETSRASMDGARLQLGFTIGALPLQVDGVVAFSNVPGNLQRPNLPLGMGVRFQDLDARQHAAIARFIHERTEALEV